MKNGPLSYCVSVAALLAAAYLLMGRRLRGDEAKPSAVSGSSVKDYSVADAHDDFHLVPSADESSLLVSDDLRLDLLLREPIVANPVYLTFDERGRLWVVQYRQYPSPAGLKLLSRDSVWRNVYDPPFPPPPPHAEDSPFRGKDCITIHEDIDGDGFFDQSKVFLDGLNLTTAALPGRGGVFVLCPPYLLFYADQDKDDRPDSIQPKVLLSGFGIEDSHAIANSLRWGPDGWIYATQGSTVGSTVVTYGDNGKPRADRPAVHSMGQNVWRYHPERQRYEIFAEGGGNAFGMEIDSQGRFYSGHNGGDTRGFHYIQGGYWQKTFSKHGQLSNPYAFDFHRPMRHHAVQRFTHTFCIYEAEGLPERYHGALFGVNPLEHRVVLSHIEPDGSSRRTRDVGMVVRPGDGERADWFTPVDVQIGPDGAIYLADWYSVQANHYRNHEGQTNPDLGRVYRLRGERFEPAAPFDLASLTSEQLVQRYLCHPNRWYRQQTLRVLGDRRDATIAPMLWDLVQGRKGQDALDAFWALHLSGGLDDERMAAVLQHPNPHVRRWAIQLIGDQPTSASKWHTILLQMACDEPNIETRLQLAATAKRLPSELAIPLIFALVGRDEYAGDIYLPKTLWWSLEAHADPPDLILRELESNAPWRSKFRGAEFTLPQNLMRRYATSGRQSDLKICAKLLQRAPDRDQSDLLVEAFATAFAGRPLPALPTALANKLSQADGPFSQLLAIRRQSATAITEALQIVVDHEAPSDQRISLIQALGDVAAAPQDSIPTFLQILSQQEPASVKNAALLALQKYPVPEIGSQIIDIWPQLAADSQLVAIQVLASRRDWATELLAAVASGTASKELVDADTLGRLRHYIDDDSQQELNALFPSAAGALTTHQARVEALAEVARQGQGSPIRGRELFHGKASCGKCHQLFATGGDVGPDLTPYNRTDAARMLLAIVNPNAEIREGYDSVTVLTEDGRILSGLKIEDTDQVFVLRGTDGQNQMIPTLQIDEIVPSATSLMPEGLLDSLTDDEVRDLLAYLASSTPPL